MRRLSAAGCVSDGARAGENCQDSYMYEPMYRTQSQSLLAFALLGRI